MDNRRKLRIGRLTEENARIRETMEKLQHEAERKDVAINKAETSAAINLEKVDLLRKQLIDRKFKIQELEDKLKDLKAKFLSQQSSRLAKDKQYKSREARLHKSAQELRAFEDAVFTKDSVIL